jgi:hypothetical protein
MFKISLVFSSAMMLLQSLIGVDANAQSFLGLSVNYGDELTFTPYYSDLLLKRKSFSPTLVYSYQKKFPSHFSVIVGGQAGIAGYQLIPLLSDPMSQSKERFPFVDYGIFVSRLEATPGKVFHIGKKEMFIGLGGGISYYLLFPFTTMSVFGEYQGSFQELFSAYIEAPDAGTFSGFAKAYVKVSISNRLDLAFQYSQHFQPILHGEFEFYQTSTPTAGSIKLIPRGVSLILLYRLRKFDDSTFRD